MPVGKEPQEMTEGARGRRKSPKRQISPVNEISLTTVRLERMNETLHAQPQGQMEEENGQLHLLLEGWNIGRYSL